MPPPWGVVRSHTRAVPSVPPVTSDEGPPSGSSTTARHVTALRCIRTRCASTGTPSLTEKAATLPSACPALSSMLLERPLRPFMTAKRRCHDPPKHLPAGPTLSSRSKVSSPVWTSPRTLLATDFATCMALRPFVSLMRRDASCIAIEKGLPPLWSLPSQSHERSSPKELTETTLRSPHQETKATPSWKSEAFMTSWLAMPPNCLAGSVSVSSPRNLSAGSASRPLGCWRKTDPASGAPKRSGSKKTGRGTVEAGLRGGCGLCSSWWGVWP
mmetsp:Transcript_16284/g.41053  ORF Transcript_16284/g.41053 Transcript_16284/m.41053 type:complete len:271 (+) Transcript_16284:516-1328(+)